MLFRMVLEYISENRFKMFFTMILERFLKWVYNKYRMVLEQMVTAEHSGSRMVSHTLKITCEHNQAHKFRTRLHRLRISSIISFKDSYNP